MSLELKLPLLMAIVLAAVLATSLIVTITTLRRTTRLAASERISRAVHEIVSVGATNLVATNQRYAAVGADSAVQRALDRARQGVKPVDPGNEARKALAALTAPTDSGMPIELWSADGERVTFLGNDLRAPKTLATSRELPQEIVAPATGGDTASAGLRFTPLYGEGDRVRFWLVLPIRRDGRTVGFITQQRQLAVGPTAQRTMRELSGDSVSLYYRNVDRSFWASGTRRSTVPVLERGDSATATLPGGESALYHEERFATTPIVVGLYLPLRALAARSRRTFSTLLLLSVVLLVAGAGAAWLIGRRVAKPLGDLTAAAGRLAAGDFSVRAPEGRDLEVQRLADSFNHMALELGSSREALERRTNEAQTANRAKSEFLTTMSHELRTPLNAIGGYVDLLAMELRGPLTEEQRRDLMRIKTSQEHLLGLISGVLDLSRIEAGRLSYSVTNVAVDSFLHGLDALVAPQASAKSIALDHVPCGADIAVVADKEKLRQIMLNLLSNAIRHTPAGGSVTMSGARRGARIAITVDDTGAGIPADRREVIFEPFVQLDRSLTQQREGLGLGLAISRDLARGMSGDLVVEDRVAGEGARFVVLLPAGNVTDGMQIDTGEIQAVRGAR